MIDLNTLKIIDLINKIVKFSRKFQALFGMECGSPEDNTAVVKMVKDLYTFLGKSPPKKQRQKIDFSNSSSIFGQSLRSNNDSSSFLNTQRKRSRENDDITMLSRNEKAELILAKSKVSKLENEVVTLQTEKKKQQIEEEKLRKLNSWKDLKEQEKNESLCSQYVMYQVSFWFYI